MTNKKVVSVTSAALLVLALDGCANRSAHVADGMQTPAAAQVPGQPGMPAAAQAPGQPPSTAVSQGAVAPSPAAASQDTRLHKVWLEGRAGAERAFCLGPGDLLEVSVPRVDEIQGLHARISPAGTITLPHLGTIQAAGLTEAQLGDRIKQRL